jgi:hypothetical protein
VTTICPLVTALDRDMASDWVRTALKKGQFRYVEGDKSFPKKIWYRDQTDRVWFGFCTNSIAGQYKGWPIDESQRVEILG